MDPNRPRICIAVAPDEFDLLFSPTDQQRLHDLATVQFAASVSADERTGRSSMELPPGMADDFDALVTSWSTAPFQPEQVRGGRLRLAAYAAGSIRRLFPREVLDRGLRVCQAGAAAMAPAVAELALTLTLALLRNVHRHDRVLASGGDWATARQPVLGRSLAAREVGLVGLGRAGRQYARMVSALGVSALRAYDPYADPDAAAAAGVTLVGLTELFERSDVISVHAPSTPETHHLVGRRELAALPDGAIVINTARSWAVDQEALRHELAAGRLLAGLDVFDEEPLAADSPFLRLPNVIVTPHVAGATVEARLMQGQIVVDELSRFVAGEPLQHEVTPGSYDLLA